MLDGGVNHFFQATIILAFLMACPSLRSEERSLGQEFMALPEKGRHWQVCLEIAIATEFGIPVETVKAQEPGFSWADLSPNLLGILQDRPKLYSNLMLLLNNNDETHHVSQGMFSPSNRLTIGDLAASMLFWITPETQTECETERKSVDTPKIMDELQKKAGKWLKETAKLTPEMRVKTWLSTAYNISHSKGISLLLFLRDARFYKVIEENFLERCKQSEDPTLVLEIAAYLRQRRAAAKSFWEEFAASTDMAHSGEMGTYYCQRADRSLLVESNSLEKALQDYLNEREAAVFDVEEIVMRSVDMYWDYHSLGIEPPSMNVPEAWENFLAILKCAVRQPAGKLRVGVFHMTASALSTYSSVLNNSTPEHFRAPQPSTWNDPVLAEVRESLKRILQGEFSADEQRIAASICVQLTIPMAPEYKEEWHNLAFGNDAPSVAPARDILYREPEVLTRLKLKPSNSLFDQFQGVTSTEWEQKFDALTWDRKWMFSHGFEVDAAFAKRVWELMRRWEDWKCEDTAPLGFVEGWKKHFAHRSLGLDQLWFLRELLQNEAENGRFWEVSASSFGIRPPFGLILKIVPQSPKQNGPENVPTTSKAYVRINLKIPAAERDSYVDEYWSWQKNQWLTFVPKFAKLPSVNLKSAMELLETRVPKVKYDGLTLEMRSFPVIPEK